MCLIVSKILNMNYLLWY